MSVQKCRKINWRLKALNIRSSGDRSDLPSDSPVSSGSDMSSSSEQMLRMLTSISVTETNIKSITVSFNKDKDSSKRRLMDSLLQRRQLLLKATLLHFCSFKSWWKNKFWWIYIYIYIYILPTSLEFWNVTY